MKSSNDVFFFTLIDFLAQVLFLAILLAALLRPRQAAAQKAASEMEKLNRVMTQAGVSNLTELTDHLSRMGPVEELKGTADFIQRAGGITKLKAEQRIIEDAGGASEVEEKLRKYDQAVGLPPCDRTAEAKPAPLATLELRDKEIAIIYPTARFDALLAKLGTNYLQVRRLELNEFKRAFAGVAAIEPNCWQYVHIRESTRLLAPAKAVAAVGFHTYGWTKVGR